MCFGGHPPDLPVFAFGNLNFQPEIGHGFAIAHGRIARPDAGGFGGGKQASFCRAGNEVAQIHGLFQLRDLFGIGRAFQLRPVGFDKFEFWAGNPRLLLTVVGEQQQALAVGIQPPGGVNTGHVYQFFQIGVFFVWRKLADIAIGFVERD